MNTLTTRIITDNYTKQQAISVLAELSLAAQKYFFGDGKLDDWQKKLLGEVKKDDVDKVFKLAEKEINSCPELIVYLAFEPSSEMVEKIGRMARKLFKGLAAAGLFLDFKLDSGIIGGAAISFGGVYRDYSLRAKFEEKKEELREIYRKRLS